MAQKLKTKYIRDKAITLAKLGDDIVVNGKFVPDLMPSLSITDIHVFQNRVNLATLTTTSGDVVAVQKGDVAFIVEDENAGGRRSSLMWDGSAWQDLKSADSVVSINNLSPDASTGNVSIDGADIPHDANDTDDSKISGKLNSLYTQISEEFSVEIDNIEESIGLNQDGTLPSMTNLLAGTALESYSILNSVSQDPERSVSSLRTLIQLLDEAVAMANWKATKNVFNKESFVVTSDIINNGFELAFTPDVKSTVVSVGRLMLHEGLDYTVSGKVITFIGDLVDPTKDDVLEVGVDADLINVTYRYLDTP